MKFLFGLSSLKEISKQSDGENRRWHLFYSHREIPENKTFWYLHKLAKNFAWNNTLRTSVSSLEFGFKFKFQYEFLLSVLSNRQPWHFLAARSRQKRVASDARMLKGLAHQPSLLSMKVSFPRATASWRQRKLSMQISSNIQILRGRPQFTFRTILNKNPIKRRRQNLHLQTGLGFYVLVDGDLLRSAHFHIEKIYS